MTSILSGTVGGPSSSTDNAVARFDSTTGKIIQNSPVTIADTTGNMAGFQQLTFSGTSSGTTVLKPAAAASGTLTLPAATDTLVGKATTDTFTNKTFDTAGAGNSFSINGVAASTNTGTGAVVRATSPALVTPALGTPSSGTLTNCTGLPVAGGGTGLASATAYAVLCGGTTSTGAFQSIAGVGTSGQVLTSNGAGALPTFQNAAAGAMDFELLNTYAPSGASSVDITSVVSSTYYSYRIEYTLTMGTDSVALYLRTSTNNGSSFDAGASNYYYLQNEFETIGTASTVLSSQDGVAQIRLNNESSAIGSAAGEGISGWIEIVNPLSTSGRQIISYASASGSTAGDMLLAFGAGAREYNAGNDIDAFRLIASSGNISGTVKVWGRRAS